MELPEGMRENWDLPKHVQDLYEAAYHAEVAWHIFDVFGYETGVLSERDRRELYAMFCHEDANSTHGLNRVSACNAFARFVKAKGGAAEFGMKDAELADWQPCGEPFNWVDMDQST
jgi:hypothetical protein